MEARRASRGNGPRRSRASSTGRSPNPSNSGRRPSPRSRTCCAVSMPNLRDFVGVGRDRDEVSRDRASRHRARCRHQARAACALVSVSSVVKVFEQTMNSVSAGVEIARRLDEIGAVDIGDEAERHVAPAVVAQRFVGHDRAEIRAADADVDDVADALAGMPEPLRRCARARRTRPCGRAPRARRARRPRHRRRMRSPAGARSATCSTARCSVVLILSPRNIASMRCAQTAGLGERAAAGAASRR